MNRRFEAWFKELILDGKVDITNLKPLLEKAFKAGSEKKKKNEPKPSYSWCVEFWLTEFHKDFTFNGIEGKAMNELIDKMDAYYFKYHSRMPTVQQSLDFFKHFCLKLPNFYKTKQLRILNQNFDGIIAEIRQQRIVNANNSAARFSEFTS